MSTNNTTANTGDQADDQNVDQAVDQAVDQHADGQHTDPEFFGPDPTENLIIAIDGPSGTGKSTVSRRVAAALGAQYLDTGAMYRVATLQVLRQGIDPSDSDAVIAATADIPLEISDDPQSTAVLLDGEDVSAEIRDNAVTANVSAVSAISEVRRNLVELQRTLGRAAGRCVVEGRDIGTVVFPDAEVKIYLTADAEVRAERRHKQNLDKGIESDFEQVLADVTLRDEKDSSRADSPLRPADNATVLDTSTMDIDDVLDAILNLVEEAEDRLYDEAEAKHNADNAADNDADTESEPDAELSPLVFRTSAGHIIDPDASAEDESAAVQEIFDDSEFGPADIGDAGSDADSDDETDEPSIDPESLDDGDFLAIDDDTDWAAVEEAFGVVDGQDFTKEALCTVAIIGRPNVGKSTLVNRFIGRREAVVEDFPGVTRDRISYLGEWTGRRFWVQDTGGWDPDAKGIHRAIARQAETAMATADVIVFVVDVKVGVTAVDEVIAHRLLRSDVPIIVVGNKFDSDTQYGDLADLWSLGLGNPYPVSAQHGRGAADVLDEVIKAFPEHPRAESVTGGPRRVALVGKPNVGKSSLLNKISGEDRAVVDNVAGTTVDPVDSLVKLDERTWTFVDTAGIRKKTRTAIGHEFYASLRTRSAIDAAEVVVLLIDASEPITEQDQRVLRLVLESGRALVVAYNKWDQVDEDRRDQLEREIDLQLAHIPWARRVNISAKTGRALQKLEPMMIEALDSWDRRISTGQLNTWLRAIIAATPPPMRSGRLPKVLFATQASSRPPVIVLFTTAFLEHGYRRFLERKLRESFGFEGSPVRIAVRVRERRQRK